MSEEFSLERNVSKTYYLKDGSKKNEVDYNEAKDVVAIYSEDKDYNKISYKIKAAGGKLYNPFNQDIRYHSRNIWKMKRVSQRVFLLYEQFLETKWNSFLIQAERTM